MHANLRAQTSTSVLRTTADATANGNASTRRAA